MTPKQFLDLVEIRVVVPSIAPLLVGLVYAQWAYGRIDWLNAALLTLATVSVHLAVNTFNRYEDDKRQQTNEFLREEARGEVVTDKQVLHVAMALGGIAVIAGVAVALLTDWVTWVIGIVSFIIGYLYSAGPKPITNTPFGELFSGVTMGYAIFVAQVYVNTQVPISLAILLQWLLVSFPLVLAIGAIMLANNIADFAEDQANQRHTLVHYLGVPTAKKWFIAWYLLAFILLAISVLVGWLPVTTLAMGMLVPIVLQNAKRFTKRPIKQENFILAIKNLVFLMLGMTVTLLFGLL
jgi:1,4-dihydroxy-2-naphthoate octaprenyltransferase